MYPFLNTDYNTSTTKDVVLVNMWNPSEGLRRGMVVAFWWVLGLTVVCFSGQMGRVNWWMSERWADWGVLGKIGRLYGRRA